MDTLALVIPVQVESGKCVVITHEPGTEDKLVDLQTYLLKDPKWVTKENLAKTTGQLLQHVGEVIASGTNVYNPDIMGLETTHGPVAFIQNVFYSAGQRITWQVIANDIDQYLDELSA